MNRRQQESVRNAPKYPLVVLRLLDAYAVDSLPGLAERMDISVNTLKSWVHRASVPLEYLHRTAETRDCSIDWLVGLTAIRPRAEVRNESSTGRVSVVHTAEPGPVPWKTARPSHSDVPQTGGGSGGRSRDSALIPAAGGTVRPLLLSLPTGPGEQDQKEFEIIPRVVRAASAGPGVPDQNQGADVIDLAGDMAYSFDWLRHNLGHTSGRVASIQVRGDSMSPTLLDGDTILIDQEVRAVDVDGIYVLDLYGRRLIKRVQQLFDGSLVLISDNAAYQREQLPRDRARDVGVLGRMVWPRVR